MITAGRRFGIALAAVGFGGDGVTDDGDTDDGEVLVDRHPSGRRPELAPLGRVCGISLLVYPLFFAGALPFEFRV